MTTLETLIEKSDDTFSLEKRDTIRISKDTAAGAVLTFAIGAVAVGVIILGQPKAFKALFEHYTNKPIYILWFVLSVIAFTLFIFKFGFNKKKKG